MNALSSLSSSRARALKTTITTTDTIPVLISEVGSTSHDDENDDADDDNRRTINHYEQHEEMGLTSCSNEDINAATTTNNNDNCQSRLMTEISLGSSEAEERGASTTTTLKQVGCCVCHVNLGRYSCPKCTYPYCSVECYKNHNNSCTESFYKNRVHSILQLEQKESTQNKNATRSLLNRVYYSKCFTNDDNMLSSELTTINSRSQHHSVHDNNCNNGSNIVSQDDLIQLLQIIEEEEEANKFDNIYSSVGNEESPLECFLQRNPKLRSIIDTHIQQQLQASSNDYSKTTGSSKNNDNMNDDYLQDWILEPWYPWWRPQLIGSCTNDDDENDDDVHCNTYQDVDATSAARQVIATTPVATTLDERILSIQAFDVLLPRNRNKSNSNEFPQLQYNLMDIVFCSCCVLRLYHGPVNAVEYTISSSLAMLDTILHISSVLSIDARYDSIDEVLYECTTRYGKMMTATTSSYPTAISLRDDDDTMTRNKALLELQHDVAILFSNPRYVARSLFELIDILKAMEEQLNVKTKRMSEKIKGATKVARNKRTNSKTKNQQTEKGNGQLRRQIKLSSNNNGASTNDNHNDNNESSNNTKVQIIRRYRKKIEFYLSWSRCNIDAVSNLPSDIERRISDWKNYHCYHQT